MTTSTNALQVRQARFDSNKMIDRNHWLKQLQLKPHVFEASHRTLFASKTNSIKNLSGNNMLEGIFGLGKTKYIDDLEWTWKMRVEGYRPLTIIENRTSSETPGKFRTDIKVLVDVDLAAIGESWSPGSSDKSQIAVLKSKAKEGRGYLYTFQVYTDNAEHYLRKEYLKPGTQWTRMYSLRGEAAESGGHSESFTNIEYQGRLNKIRKSFKVTDYGSQAVLEMAIKDSEGKTRQSWMTMQEAEYYKAMNMESAKLALFGRISDSPLFDPDSGYPIVPGAGLEQQISFGGNVERYTTLSVELIEAFFAKMVYSRISPGDLGEIVMYTGYYGMSEFAKVLDTWTGGKTIIRESNMFMSKDSRGVHNNSLRTGYQFVTYDLPNGGSVRLIYNPFNDDRSLHRDIDPILNIPLQSQRFTILDVTGGNGSSINTADNICLVRKNKVFGTTVIPGRVGPGGHISSNAVHSGDYYEVHMSDSIGIEVKDPTVTGELIKAIH